MFKRYSVSLALLLVSATAHAYSYRWEGTVDYGSKAGQTVSGSFTGHGQFLTKLDLVIGGSLYNYTFEGTTGGMLQPSFASEFLTDVPLSREGEESSSDLQWWTTGWNLQTFFKNVDADPDDNGGKVTWLQRDASPTPEPSSFLLLGSGLLAFGGYRFKRRASRWS